MILFEKIKQLLLRSHTKFVPLHLEMRAAAGRAAAGPIAFIALAGPQIARRITRSAGVTLIASALTGSLLLTAADYAARHAFATQLPVGIMTVSIGGIYFLWLLVKEGRR